MSRNNKNALRHEKAREISRMHLKGEKGPSKTTPQHHKRWGYRTNPEVQKRIAEQLKASQPQEKTSGKKILSQAGGASRDD